MVNPPARSARAADRYIGCLERAAADERGDVLACRAEQVGCFGGSEQAVRVRVLGLDHGASISAAVAPLRFRFTPPIALVTLVTGGCPIRPEPAGCLASQSADQGRPPPRISRGSTHCIARWYRRHAPWRRMPMFAVCR